MMPIITVMSQRVFQALNNYGPSTIETIHENYPSNNLEDGKKKKQRSNSISDITRDPRPSKEWEWVMNNIEQLHIQSIRMHL